jgi:hypothetical protein|tara:strand:+ start:1132 stop:1866 length:735 start_codon:yes stop_codon:yes gene_type:complete
MKKIISLTSIPSRFKTLPAIVYDLEKHQDIDEIWVNIPYKYNRFPDTEVVLPDFSLCSKVVINRCIDYGPGTMYMGPANSDKCDADIVIVVNDDTKYPSNLTSKLVELYESDHSCWCLSGFRVDEYVKNNGQVGRYDKQYIDVTESYGGVILDMKWLRDMKDLFLDFYKLTYNDDIIISNLLSKMNITKKSICDQTMNISMIRQYSYGMGEDALFQNNGEGSHVENNKRVFKTLEEMNMLYIKK